MSDTIDKFGRKRKHGNSIAGTRGPAGPPGDGFRMNPDGHYDIEHKPLVNVVNPVNDNDAVNKRSTLIIEEADEINCRHKRLSNVADPSFPQNALKLKYFQDKRFNFENKRLQSVYIPQDPTDACKKQNVDTWMSNLDKLHTGSTDSFLTKYMLEPTVSAAVKRELEESTAIVSKTLEKKSLN